MDLAGDRTIALALTDGPELAVTYLAVSGAAKCAVLNPAYRSQEFDFCFSDLDVNALIVQAGSRSEAVSSARKRGLPVLEIRPAAKAEAGMFEFDLQQTAAGRTRTARRMDDVALQLHTSGTTSKPKVVCLTHALITAAAQNVQASLQLSPSDRCLNVMPLFHAHGLIIAVASSLFSGGSVICTTGFDPTKFFEWLESSRPTWYTAAPAIHKAILEQAKEQKPGAFSTSLRLIRSSAAPLQTKLLTQLENTFRVTVLQGYGMTECPLIASNPPDASKPGSVGRPAGPEMTSLDEQGNQLKAGQIGEIAIRGACVAGPYEKEWFRTGDAGYLDNSGYLFLTGRLKEIINRGGQKISPLEVDTVLLKHPAVAEAVTFGFPHERLGEEIAAAVVLRKNSHTTEREIRDFVVEQLVEYKVPRRIFIVGDLPRSPTTKVLRESLANQFDLNKRLSEGDAKASNIVEERLAALWTKVLEIHPVGVRESFFQLGGDSILATRLVSLIRKEFQVELPLRSFFDTPTIAEIAEALASGPPEPSVKICADTEQQVNTVAPEIEGYKKRSGQLEWSLFFFSADGSTLETDKYNLLLKSAKFADDNGFAAVWTPERHFHPFGGLYPNPAVIGAALAMITKRIRIRAGSVVLPLQNPLRVAEEWAVVDNLSHGRVEISCASGWHANDFVLSPTEYNNRKQIMFERMETIQKLWRGEKILLPNGAGKPVEVGIFPRPFQKRLPMWLSCHSDETFRRAAELGVNVVTTLYNTTVERVAAQIEIYRTTLSQNGHDPDSRTVALMLHTFIGLNRAFVMKKVQSAYSDYLLTFLGLHKDQAEGMNREFDLTEGDKTFILSRAIDGLYEVRDLVGTPETCRKRVELLRSIGVNEIACLIDFGIDNRSVITSLHQLNELRRMNT